MSKAILRGKSHSFKSFKQTEHSVQEIGGVGVGRRKVGMKKVMT